MKTIRMEVVIYYEVQDSTTQEEAEDVMLEAIEKGGFKFACYKSDVVKDDPDDFCSAGERRDETT